MAELDLDETHDPRLESRVDSANRPETDFPIQNLPLGLFRRAPGEDGRIGVAIGNLVLDLHGSTEAGLLPDGLVEVCRAPTLNALLAAGKDVRRALRRAVSSLLAKGGPVLNERLSRCSFPRPSATIQISILRSTTPRAWDR